MKFSYLLWFSLSVAGPVSGLNNNRTLHDMIHEERRYVLFNSRRLSGECLDICVPDATSPPTEAEDPVGMETQSPTDSPITGSPTASPTNKPTASPTNKPTTSPTNKPTASPTNKLTASPTNVPTASPTVALAVCEDLENLGRGFSEATSIVEGQPAYGEACYPPITVKAKEDWNEATTEFDDSVSVFVGKDYIGLKGAEVEGKIVVLRNLKMKRQGPPNFVTVGGGTHVVPHPDTDSIIVGGNLEAHSDINVCTDATWMKCNIVYKGNQKKMTKWKTHGTVLQDPNYDMQHYFDMKEIFIKKSKYWATLESTGAIDKSNPWEILFQCSDLDEIQVFNFAAGDDSLEDDSISDFRYSDSCEGKSILINAPGEDTIRVLARGTSFKGKSGYGPDGFSTCLTQSILWNFPSADKVKILNKSEFHGSILTGNPDGLLIMETTGHSGRVIVVGTIEHDKASSEFHSYPYNPPKALPDQADICDMPR